MKNDALILTLGRRQNLAKTMDDACKDHAPVIVTRKASHSVVIMSLEDFQAREETAYLLRSPKNTRRLIERPPFHQTEALLDFDAVWTECSACE